MLTTHLFRDDEMLVDIHSPHLQGCPCASAAVVSPIVISEAVHFQRGSNSPRQLRVQRLEAQPLSPPWPTASRCRAAGPVRGAARRGLADVRGARARRRQDAPQLLAAELEADGFGRAAEGGECRCCSCCHRGLGPLLVTKGARTLKQKEIWIREKVFPGHASWLQPHAQP